MGTASSAGAAVEVSVVVPTVGRPSLVDAVRSVLDQRRPPNEVVVVADRTGVALPIEVAVDPRVRLVETTGGLGPSAARNAGVGVTTGTLVAFLDDDDRWLPTYLTEVVAAWDRARDRGAHAVVATTALDVDGDDRVVWDPGTTVLPAGHDLGEALVGPRSVVRPHARLEVGSSGLVAPRVLLVEEPFDEARRLHEDWEWLLRVTARPEVALVVLPEPLLRYRTAPAGATASRPGGGWALSATLADHPTLTPRARGDLLVFVSARLAIAERAWRPAAGLVRRGFRDGRPSARAVVVTAVDAVVTAVRAEAAVTRVLVALRTRRPEVSR